MASRADSKLHRRRVPPVMCVYIPHVGRKELVMKSSRKQNPKGVRRKKSSDFDLLVENISSLADSLMAMYRQSYNVLRPIVDDICQRKESVTQNELDHCFDYLLNISCTDFGKRLFDRLCVTFKSKYPDSVDFYVKEDESLYGDGTADDDAMQSDTADAPNQKTSRKKKSSASRSKKSSLDKGLRSKGETCSKDENAKGDVAT